MTFSPIDGSAQNTKSIDTLSFDEKCVSILLESKIGVTDVDSLILQLIDQSKYASQLKAILINGIAGQKADSTANNFEIQQALNQIQFHWQALEKKRLNSICQNYGVDMTIYESFLQRWKSDISLQQSLRPFIDKKLQP